MNNFNKTKSLLMSEAHSIKVKRAKNDQEVYDRLEKLKKAGINAKSSAEAFTHINVDPKDVKKAKQVLGKIVLESKGLSSIDLTKGQKSKSEVYIGLKAKTKDGVGVVRDAILDSSVPGGMVLKIKMKNGKVNKYDLKGNLVEAELVNASETLDEAKSPAADLKKELESSDFGMTIKGGNGVVKTAGKNIVVYDSYFYGGREALDKHVDKWSPKGHMYEYFKDEGFDIKVVKKGKNDQSKIFKGAGGDVWVELQVSKS